MCIVRSDTGYSSKLGQEVMCAQNSQIFSRIASGRFRTKLNCELARTRSADLKKGFNAPEFDSNDAVHATISRHSGSETSRLWRGDYPRRTHQKSGSTCRSLMAQGRVAPGQSVNGGTCKAGLVKSDAPRIDVTPPRSLNKVTAFDWMTRSGDPCLSKPDSAHQLSEDKRSALAAQAKNDIP
jgi:hypothetical protein